MMLAALLALLSAFAYGTSDFVGGLLSRTRSPWRVATVSFLTAAAATAAAGLIVTGDPRPVDFAWAAVAGIGEGVGLSFLYRGLSRGRMGVVAPVSGTGAAVVPVVAGLIAGDAPSWLTWAGIALALPAMYLVPQTSPERSDPDGAHAAGHGLLDGVIAGLGFGAQFALVDRIRNSAGVLPLSLFWVCAAITAAVVATVLREPWIPQRVHKFWPVLSVGLISTVALVFFLLATRQGQLTVVSVIAALYPAVTVVLAAVLLKEGISRLQTIGLVLATVAIVLVALG